MINYWVIHDPGASPLLVKEEPPKGTIQFWTGDHWEDDATLYDDIYGDDAFYVKEVSAADVETLKTESARA